MPTHSLDVGHNRPLGVTVLRNVLPAAAPVKVEAGQRIDVAQGIEGEGGGHTTWVVVRIVDDSRGLSLAGRARG